jgi:recombination protein RecT
MNAITTYDQTRSLLRSEEARKRFEEILGDKDKAQAFLASVLSVVYQSNNLSQCDPQTVMFAAMKAATLDLPVEPNLGQSYIIPYKSKATFQIGYKGIIQLALRTQQYLIINATEVYEGEEIKQNRLTGVISLNGKRSSDKIIGYASYFKMKSGYEHYLYMTVEDLVAYAKRYSPSYNYNDTLWHTNFDAMAKKTVLKMNLLKYGELRISTILSAGIEADEENVVQAEVISNVPVAEKETEKKPAKKKEEKVQPEDPLPATTEVPSISYPNDPPPMPEQIGDAFPPRDEDFGTPMWQRLVVAGIFAGDVTAKTVMRFYTGQMDWKDVEPWARKVKSYLDKGNNIPTACGKVNDETT